MNEALQQLMDQYKEPGTGKPEDQLREVVQHLSLLGLWRSGFYHQAAFYGGTALRVFHGLDRFSEDMDFSLLVPDSGFELSPHLDAIRNELTSFGLSFRVEQKTKPTRGAIESAFLKGNTATNLLIIEADSENAAAVHPHLVCKIELEVDTDPPPGARFEMKTVLVPIPFQVKLYTLPDLFAGKLHAVLCRSWKNRVKGRDYYDLVWYIGRNVPCHTAHLQARMVQSGHLEPDAALNRSGLIQRLQNRFEEVDFRKAADDVRPFVKDPDALKLWSRGFFDDIVKKIQIT